MNNKIIIGVIVAVLVVGGGWYAMSGKSGSSAQSAAVGAVSSGNAGTMNQLLASKDTLECSYTQINDQVNATGIFYVANGKVRGDFIIQTKSSATVPSQKLEQHLITDGQKVLLWPLTQQDVNQGVVVAVDPVNKNQVNLDQPIDAVCKPWIKDDSKFIPPTVIKFTDVNVLEKAFKAQTEAATKTATTSI